MVMIKASHLHPAVLSAYRLLLSALLLAPFYFRNLKKYRNESMARHLRVVLPPALGLALHFITWTQGAQWTHAANATLIVCMVPVVMPFLLYFMVGEVISRAELLGTLVALGGAAWLSAADFSVSRQSWWGDVTCFVSMLLFSYYLAQGRVNRGFPSIWLYLVPLYAVAGLICLVIALFMADPFRPQPPREYLLVLGQALVPTILGHSIYNYAMKHVRGQVVSIVNLFQFLFAGALAYYFFGEVPRSAFYVAGALVVAGAIVAIRAIATTRVGKRELDEMATTTPEA